MQGIHAAASAADKAIIAEAKRKHPDLLIYSEHPNRPPVLCDATGLALFEGDELYGGDPQYGSVILKAAVKLTVPQIEALGRKALKD
jgi:hypothetical protein